MIKSHRGGVETLGLAEKFYLDLSKIPYYAARIKALLLVSLIIINSMNALTYNFCYTNGSV